MRTTIQIDPDLLAAAKSLAVQRRTTLTSLIEDALRESLNRRALPAVEPAALPTFDGRLRPGVDLDDSAALLALMDGDAAS